MKASSILFAALALSQMGATDCGGVLRDPGFDLWCGDGLCAWKTERGDVKKVATWNEGDPGVELVGEDVAIEQLSPVASSDGSCIEFDLIANVDINSQVALNIDVFGDGSIEHTQPIPTSSWAPLSYRLPITGTFDGIRFEITKRGTGTAQLAQVGAKIVTDGCEAFSPITPAPGPDGAFCRENAGCTSGICDGYTCAGCKDGTCAATETCGVGRAISPIDSIPRECVATGTSPLGETCLVDAECASGICTPNGAGSLGTCSTCDPAESACASGAACGIAWSVPFAPHVCAPNGHTGIPGAACSTNADCMSNACHGTDRYQCDDGRACASAADCPFGDDLQNGPCNSVAGKTGGSCE
ncbi:MAG TPA: hypothetical protein VGC41_15025 [Kofleriaceae bacterium]